MRSLRQPNEAEVANCGANRVIENVRAEKEAVKMQSRLVSNGGVRAELLEKGVLKRMAELMAQTLVESTNEPGRVEKGFVIILRSNSYRNKNSLPVIRLTAGELALEAHEPVIALTTQTILTSAARDHQPLAGDIPRAESQGRLGDIRTVPTRVLLVEIAAVANPYGR